MLGKRNAGHITGSWRAWKGLQLHVKLTRLTMLHSTCKHPRPIPTDQHVNVALMA